MALQQNSKMTSEHHNSLIGFVWRPEEITPAVMQMAQRTGSRAVFDFSTMSMEGLRSFLEKADLAGQLRDIRISVPAFLDPSLGQLLRGNRNPGHLGRVPPPVFSRRSSTLFAEIEGIVEKPPLLSNHR